MSIKGLITTELVAFDFDETIIDCESDTFIGQLAPNGAIPSELYEPFKNDPECIGKMQQVFEYLFANGVREEDYKQCLATMPFVDSMKPLLANLAVGDECKQFEVIILSDASTFLIDYTLKCNQIDHVIKKLFTNRSHFDSNGCLRLERCHLQDWCKLSPPNLCKGHLLKDYVSKRTAEGMNFERINYVGDGSNDLCPSLKLSHNDRVFPRVGFPLASLVAARVDAKELPAQVFPFTCGDDIWKILTQHS